MDITKLLETLGVEATDENKEAIAAHVEHETAGIRTNRDKYKREKENAKDRLSAFEGMDLEEVAEALGAKADELDLSELPDLIRAASKPTGEADHKNDERVAELERRLERAQKKLTDAEEAGKARSDALKAAIGRAAAEAQITAAITDKEGNAHLLKPHALGRVKYDVDDDGHVEITVLAPNGEPMEDSKGNPAKVADLIEEFAHSDHFMAAFPPDPGGTGEHQSQGVPGGGKNPWHPDSLNVTEQARLMREKPAAAARLKAAAGAA
jgi:hypothetical protein